KLLLDPVGGACVALRTLLAVAELRQAVHELGVALEAQTLDDRLRRPILRARLDAAEHATRHRAYAVLLRTLRFRLRGPDQEQGSGERGGNDEAAAPLMGGHATSSDAIDLNHVPGGHGSEQGPPTHGCSVSIVPKPLFGRQP